MSEQEDFSKTLMSRGHDAFKDNLHKSEKGWVPNIAAPLSFTLTCDDCRKQVIASLQTFDLSGLALSQLCPEPPPQR